MKTKAWLAMLSLGILLQGCAVTLPYETTLRASRRQGRSPSRPRRWGSTSWPPSVASPCSMPAPTAPEP